MDGVPQPLTESPQLRTLLLTDLCDSTELVERLGDAAAAELFREHDTLVLRLQQQWRGRLIDRSDGLLLLFERPIDGLGFALDYQQGLRDLGHARGLRLLARAGLHVGEVLTWRNSAEAVQIGAKPLEVEGLAKPVAARLMALARPGQTLLSAVAESLTQRAARELGERGERLLWKSHGYWRFKGMPTRMEVYEVGEIGLTPLRAPKSTQKAWRDIPLWRRPAALVAEVAVVAMIAAGGWLFTRPEPAIAFAERDWVVVGDMRNLTGDTLLDDSLQQAFRISLEQSRYVNVVSEDRASRTLAMMRNSAQKPLLDRRTTAGVAQRLGIGIVLMPSVADIGGRKRFTVEVVDSRSHQTLGVSSEFASRGDLLAAVDKVTHDLRDKLGESEMSIRQNAAPLPEVTTTSLDALRAYALGQKRYANGDYEGALSFYRSATEMDPEFALAWLAQTRAYYAGLQHPQAVEALKKALALSAHLPPREEMYARNWRLQILEPAKAADGWMQMSELYPDYLPAAHNAALNLFEQNRIKEALPLSQRVAGSRIDLSSVGMDQYGRILLALNDFDSADKAFSKAGELGWDGALLRRSLAIAAKGDFSRASALLDQIGTGQNHDDLARTSIALDQGQPRKAVEFAKAGLAKSEDGPVSDRLSYYVPLATSYMAAGNGEAALETARAGAKLALENLDQQTPTDAITNLEIALGAGIVAQRVGDTSLAASVLKTLREERQVPRTRALSELASVLEAGQLRLAGKPGEALRTLSAYLDDYSRVQTRAAALQAAEAARIPDAAAAQRAWLQEHRGLAYIEVACGYCLQPINVWDVDSAATEPSRGQAAVAAAVPHVH